LFSVNGVPRPPEHTLVAEFRRELTQIRDRINYLLNRLGINDESDQPKGGQQQPIEKQSVQGLWGADSATVHKFLKSCTYEYRSDLLYYYQSYALDLLTKMMIKLVVKCSSGSTSSDCFSWNFLA